MAWRRQWCHLCELPKPPWAVVWDFSEAVCRGCVNFEGAGRIEPLLAAARRLRGHHHEVAAAAAAAALGLPPTPAQDVPVGAECRRRRDAAAVPPSSRDVPMELSEALCGRVALESTERRPRRHPQHHDTALAPGVPAGLSEALCGHVALESTERRPRRHPQHHDTALAPGVPAGLSEALCGRITVESTERRPRRHPQHHDTALAPGVPAGLSEALCGRITVESTERRPRRHPQHHDTALAPGVPAGLSAALRGRAEAWPGKPRAVRERLSVLAGCAPFAVRFRKDHALVGRVLAFDAAPRAGQGDFELRLFAEYPCGSGSVYGVLGLARRMFQDCLRTPGKAISSGYKYLEYEKRQGSGDWRSLGELFTEAVRFFRHPPAPEALPQQHRHLPSVAVLPPPPPLPPPPAAPPRRRRKASPEPRVLAAEALSCGRCRRLLEDTHFVQCPAVPEHRFCFPCARRAIRARGAGAAVHCPSGGRCPLAGSGLPWAFMQGEIAAILAGDVRVKRERDP
ncbi:interferon regulatory factor 2-binding protein 1-like [Aphelocoma coerulescens]|uniref:interferon regulatory factor 2-binding protein 1-like n=1 Tax=Aphelocoma coerulescens TaxID=39617 RepID=UPI003604306D